MTVEKRGGYVILSHLRAPRPRSQLVIGGSVLVTAEKIGKCFALGQPLGTKRKTAGMLMAGAGRTSGRRPTGGHTAPRRSARRGDSC